MPNAETRSSMRKTVLHQSFKYGRSSDMPTFSDEFIMFYIIL